MVVGLTFALISAFLTGFAWVAHYQPLVRGSYGFWIRTPIRQRVVDVSLAEGPADTLVHFWVRPGDRFVDRISIRNDGALAVEVTSVGEPNVPGDSAAAFTETPIRLQLDQSKLGTLDGERFRPFILEPDAEAVVTMRVDITGCRTKGTISSWRDVRVAFTVLGVHRETFVPTWKVLAMHGINPC